MSRSIFISTTLTLGICAVALAIQVHPVAAEGDLSGNEGVLKVLTLNVAHGRKKALSQMIVSGKKIRQNLTEIADVLRRQEADVVALQEADGASRWSGNFDHVAFMADQAGYPWFFSAAHANSWLFTYGTALLSRFPMSQTLAHTFKPSPPTLSKGFLLGRMLWKPNPKEDRTIPIDIVSVHLDFSRKKVRQQQIIEITDVLSTRSGPMIILGDFNSEWFADGSVVKRLADRAQMKVYRPDATHLQTYPKGGKRLDWILISGELDFVGYEVLSDVLSDHQAVVARVTLHKPKAQNR